MPNIDIVIEMIEMIAISHLYEGINEYSRNNFKILYGKIKNVRGHFA